MKTAQCHYSECPCLSTGNAECYLSQKGVAVAVSHLHAIILRVIGQDVFIIFCEMDPFLSDGVTIIWQFTQEAWSGKGRKAGQVIES